MTTETTTPAAEAPQAPVVPAAPAAPAKIIVTSTMTIDFPKLKWGINAGKNRALPVDAGAQAIILANKCITVVK